ncbi:MAG TPA: prenyltransferase/squalene oxidase repeat-containing protein [Bryobacteraceae bacterium]|nr:prenyltransferase/squalene oxidase repeat-containing protein [Bryobacteraceae bacterium]
MSSVGGVYLESRLKFLRRTQNPDGGWGYFPDKQSWFEPTTYAMLALQSAPGTDASLDRAFKLLRSWQTPDGSSRPSGEVQGGTWVTAQAVTLACVRGIYDDKVRNSVDWLLRVVGAESSAAMRAAAFFHLLKTKADFSHEGWPWRDGNASWVEPTAQALVALKKVSKKNRSPELDRRVSEGEALLLSRRCSDGGWNQGNPNVLNYDLPSYPETTALALLGLQGRSRAELDQPLALAARFRAETRSSLARAWLVIALRCHGGDPQPAGQDTSASTDIMLTALQALGHPEGNYGLLRTGAPA